MIYKQLFQVFKLLVPMKKSCKIIEVSKFFQVVPFVCFIELWGNIF